MLSVSLCFGGKCGLILDIASKTDNFMFLLFTFSSQGALYKFYTESVTTRGPTPLPICIYHVYRIGTPLVNFLKLKKRLVSFSHTFMTGLYY